MNKNSICIQNSITIFERNIRYDKQKRPDGLVCYIVTQVYEHIQFFDTIRKKNEIFYS